MIVQYYCTELPKEVRVMTNARNNDLSFLSISAPVLLCFQRICRLEQLCPFVGIEVLDVPQIPILRPKMIFFERNDPPKKPVTVNLVFVGVCFL